MTAGAVPAPAMAGRNFVRSRLDFDLVTLEALPLFPISATFDWLRVNPAGPVTG
jgi:hypothetical protein